MADNNLLMVAQGVRLNRPHSQFLHFSVDGMLSELAPSTFGTAPPPSATVISTPQATVASANTAIKDILKATAPVQEVVMAPIAVPITNGVNGK